MDIIGVNKDSLKSHRKFIADYDLPFLLLTDPDAGMMTAYGAYGEKVSCGRKTIGTIRSTVIVGSDGLIRKHWPKVSKADEHAEQVLAFLQQMP